MSVLTASINIITTAAAGSGVRLSPSLNARVRVVNRGANAVLVYRGSFDVPLAAAQAHYSHVAWLLRQDGMIVIPKATALTHVEEDVAALDLTLTADDLTTLDRAFPPPKKATSLDML